MFASQLSKLPPYKRGFGIREGDRGLGGGGRGRYVRHARFGKSVLEPDF